MYIIKECLKFFVMFVCEFGGIFKEIVIEFLVILKEVKVSDN